MHTFTFLVLLFFPSPSTPIAFSSSVFYCVVLEATKSPMVSLPLHMISLPLHIFIMISFLNNGSKSGLVIYLPIFLFENFVTIIFCVCACDCIHVEVRGQVARVGSLLPPVSYHGFSSGCQTWWQGPLSTELPYPFPILKLLPHCFCILLFP